MSLISFDETLGIYVFSLLLLVGILWLYLELENRALNKKIKEIQKVMNNLTKELYKEKR